MLPSYGSPMIKWNFLKQVGNLFALPKNVKVLTCLDPPPRNDLMDMVDAALGHYAITYPDDKAKNQRFSNTV